MSSYELKDENDDGTANAKRYMDENDGAADRYATCCCGPCRTNIETAIYIVATIGFLLNLGLSVPSFLLGNAYIGFGVLCYAAPLAYVFVVVAQYKRKLQWFLPCFIILGLMLVIYVLDIGWMILALTAVKSLPFPPMIQNRIRIVLIIALVYVVLVLALSGWFYYIIFRAYKHVKHVIGIGGNQELPQAIDVVQELA